MKRWFIFFFCVLGLGIALSRIVPRVQPVRAIVLAEREEEEDEVEDRTTTIVPNDVSTTTVTPALTPSTVTNSVETTTNTVMPTSVTPEATSTLDQTATAETSPTIPVISTHFPWAWLVARATGIMSFILLSLLSVTGILLTTGVLYRYMSPATAWSLHRAIGSVLLFSVFAHLAGIYFDNFVRLGLSDIFIPFLSSYRPVLVSLGIFGFYLLLLILASSLYVMTSHAKFWRSVHFFSFPMYILIFLHGILIGTDAQQWWMFVIYYGSAVFVGLAVIYRLVWKMRSRRRLPSGS